MGSLACRAFEWFSAGLEGFGLGDVRVHFKGFGPWVWDLGFGV